VLPTSIGATIATSACFWRQDSREPEFQRRSRAMKRPSRRHPSLITVPVLVDQIKDFPWLENRIDMPKLCKGFRPPI